ncbi:hypothetical protein Tco_1367411 [Tanacetum coccineum]
MLDDFDRQDVLELYRLVKEIFETASPEGYDRLRWGDLITVFESSEDDEIWKAQQDYTLISLRLFDSFGVHVLLIDTGIAIHMLIEKTYPLTKEILSRMLSRRLEANHECEMAYELFRCVSGKSTDLDRLRPSRASILWGMFYQKNVGYVALLWEDFMFQADNKEISSARTLKFVSKTKDYQKYGALIPEEMINQAIKDSKEYKTYLKFASGKVTPKKPRKFKNIASPSEKLTPILEEEPAQKPKRAKNPEPAKQAKTAKRSARAISSYYYANNCVVIRDTLVPDELQDKKTGINKGTGTIPGVPDVPKDQSGSEKESWEIVEMIMIVMMIIAMMMMEFNEEEYEEIYGDVNISLKNGNQVKDDVQATQKTEGLIPSSSIFSDYAAKYLNFDNIPPVDIEVVSMLDINVQHEVPCTSPLLTILMSVILEHTIVNPPKIVTSALSTTIYSLLITDLEKDVKELKTTDHSAALLSTIKSEVPKAINEYLGTSLDDALHKVLKKHLADLAKKHSVLVEVVERFRKQYVPEKSTKDIIQIKMEHARKQQEPKETITSSDTSALEEFD